MLHNQRMAFRCRDITLGLGLLFYVKYCVFSDHAPPAYVLRSAPRMFRHYHSCPMSHVTCVICMHAIVQVEHKPRGFHQSSASKRRPRLPTARTALAWTPPALGCLTCNAGNKGPKDWANNNQHSLRPQVWSLSLPSCPHLRFPDTHLVEHIH